MKKLSVNRWTVAAFLAVIACAGVYISPLAAQDDARVVRITAKRFAYDPAVVTLKKGVPVTLELTSQDVVMGFRLPDFDVRSDIVPGKTARVRFVPDKTGKFEFVCDIFCGTGHEEMNGVVMVVE